MIKTENEVFGIRAAIFQIGYYFFLISKHIILIDPE